MALQVWLPLNKNNLNNVGLAENIEITSTNTEFKEDVVSPLENGARLFKSNNSNLTLPSNNTLIKNKPEISLAFWCYQTIATGQTIFTFMKSYSDFAFYNNKLYVRTNGNGGDISGNALQLTLPQQAINEWHHYAFTFNKGLVNAYIDGAFSKSGITAENDTMFSGMTAYYIGGYSSTYKFSGYTCDFRLYDNALTEYDVKRLYQCKVFGIDSHGWSTDTFVADTFDGYRQSKPVNIVATPYSLKFNGNSYIDTEGINMTGGTLSAWFTMSAIPTTNSSIIYCDQKSKMAIGFYTGNKLIVTCNRFAGNTYIHSNKLLANKWNNVTIVYNKSDGKPSICYINGSPATNSTENYWTSTGELLSIGRRYGGASPNYFNGSIGKIDVYSKSFTEEEILKKYESEKNLFLPDDYIQLEYIEGTGEQWIDCSVKANQDTVVEIEFEITGNETGYGAVFGARTNGSSNCFNVWTKCGNGKIGCQIGNSGSKNCNTTQAANVIYKLKTSNGNITVNGDSVDFTPVSNFETPLNVRIFDIANGNTSSSGTSNRILIGKVYSFKLYESNIIIRNMIPSKRKSDNVIGMYDMVSGQFFTNAGSGSFTGA